MIDEFPLSLADSPVVLGLSRLLAGILIVQVGSKSSRHRNTHLFIDDVFKFSTLCIIQAEMRL